MELICPVFKYHWGKTGFESLVADLKHAVDPSYDVNSNEHYAELWMGTHPGGPALLKSDNSLLQEWISQHPSALGEKVQSLFGNNLPFLFKILSIGSPLSIQVHPSKKTAEELNKKFPDIYRDDNHKPELAIALSNFEALCGFRPFEEIKQFFIDVPELTALVGQEKVTAFLASEDSNQELNLEKCFRTLMTASENEVKVQLASLLKRAADTNMEAKILATLLKKIHNHFPGDIGCFCIYFFNYLVLKPGEALYLDAGEPHAYIFGDCVECMACSDNVARAGLTLKYRDVNTLCEILRYSFSSASSKILSPLVENSFSAVYKTPHPDFAVCKVCVKPGQTYDLSPRISGSICIITQGVGCLDGTEISRGKIFFFAANEQHSIQVPPSCEALLLFQAFTNI